MEQSQLCAALTSCNQSTAGIKHRFPDCGEHKLTYIRGGCSYCVCARPDESSKKRRSDRCTAAVGEYPPIYAILGTKSSKKRFSEQNRNEWGRKTQRRYMQFSVDYSSGAVKESGLPVPRFRMPVQVWKGTHRLSGFLASMCCLRVGPGFESWHKPIFNFFFAPSILNMDYVRKIYIRNLTFHVPINIEY